MKNIEEVKGVIELKDNGEGHKALKVGGDVLAERVKELIAKHGSKLVSVRYYTSDKIIHSIGEASEEFLKRVMGFSNAYYCMNYSEVTGYLWTDENFKVGGHDLIEELSTQAGKYLLLEISFHDQKSYEMGIEAARVAALDQIKDMLGSLEFYMKAPCLEKEALLHLQTRHRTLVDASSQINSALVRMQ